MWSQATEARAIKDTWRKMVGVFSTGPGKPVQYGNCFGVEFEDGTHGRVINFSIENLEKLIKLGLTWPVQCLRVGPVTVIHDGRIGERWYSEGFCEICCPRDLLPIDQRHAQLRDILRGRRVERPGSISITIGKSFAQFE